MPLRGPCPLLWKPLLVSVILFIHDYFISIFIYFFSSFLSKDRVVPRDLNIPKKESDFYSVFQQIQAAQLRRSPSELFAQHLVSIVHYIKGRVCDMWLCHSLTGEGGDSRRGNRPKYFIFLLSDISYCSWV